MRKEKQSNYGDGETQEFPVNFIPDKSGTYIIEILSEIESASQFSTAIQVLGMAREEDSIEIRLSSPGGVVDGTDSFLHALRKCQAPIHIVATGLVASMATHILLESDSFELGNGFHALVHTGSGGSYGNMNEVRVQNKFDDDFRIRKFKEAYEGMFTEKEINEILEGKDRWLDAQEWVERAEKRSVFFKAKYAKMLKEQNKKIRTKKQPTTEE